MDAMWKPRKFKYIYLLATLYVFTLTIPSAAAAYWAFGDQLLTHANAFSLLPHSGWRDAAVILMLIHQVPVYYIFSHTYMYIFGIIDEFPLNPSTKMLMRDFIGIPVHNIWVRVHSALLCVGEGDRDAPHEEHILEGARPAAGGDPHLVPGHHFPLLWADQLRRGRPLGQLHCLHHPRRCPHGHFPVGLCPAGQ